MTIPWAAWGGQIVVTPEVLATNSLPVGAGLQDLGVHLLKDLAEPQQVFGLIHPSLPLQEFPALRSLSAQPNNLPRQATPLVGRQEEPASINDLLRKADCRLLSVQPSFDPTPEDLRTITRICRLVQEGMPLAIGPAATWINMLS